MYKRQPFDFDSTDLKASWQDAIKLFNFITSLNYDVQINYTGNRGFHVLVKTVPDYYTKAQLRGFQRLMKNILDLKTVDEQLFGDYRRLIRIPNTYHRKGGLCYTIAHNTGRLLNLGKLIKHSNNINLNISESYKDQKTHEFPCIIKLLKEDSEPPQLARFQFVVNRLIQGKTMNEILEEIKTFGWIDFSEDYTIKQIKQIASHSYLPMSCDRIQDLGWCLGEKCKYYFKPLTVWEWKEKYEKRR